MKAVEDLEAVKVVKVAEVVGVEIEKASLKL